MYKNVEFEVLQAPLRVLRWHLMWPQPDENIRDKWTTIKAIAVSLFCSFTICGCLMHLHYCFKHPETIIMVDLIEDIIMILVHITIYYQIYSLLIHRRDIEEFINDLNDFTQFGKPPTIEEVNKRSNWFTYCYYIYGWSGAFVYSLVGILDRKHCIETDINHTRICGFLIPVRYPIDTNSSISFVGVWLVQTINIIILLNNGISIMALIYASIQIYISKIIHMRNEILKLGQRPDRTKEGIKFCVDYHVKIINMNKNLNLCWGRLMLYHDVFITMILSLIGIQYMLEPDPKCIIHAGGWFISLVIPCYAGQRLQDETSEIPWSMYSTQWYNLDNATRKNLVYMIMCANNDLVLNRDGYGPMNLSIVGRVVNNIYSLLTLLYGSIN